METSTAPAEAHRLTAEEDPVASQLLEIIGGIASEALQSPEEPEDRGVWSVEEGDDSVFYSDEDQAHHQDAKTNSTDEVDPRAEDDPGRESITDKGNADLENEATQQAVPAERAEEDLQAPKTECAAHSDPGAPSSLPAEEPGSACGESLPGNRTNADTQGQAGPNAPSEEANLAAEKEEVSPSLGPFDVTNEESCVRLAGEAAVPDQMPGAGPQMSAHRQLQVDQDAEREHRIHAPAGFRQNPGYSATLPLPRKASHRAGGQNSFDHLTSSAYSTVSYRKIRRGNTRQKIEEFEYMIMNL